MSRAATNFAKRINVPVSRYLKSAAGSSLLAVSLAAAGADAPIPAEKYMDSFEVEVAKGIYRVIPPNQTAVDGFVLIPQTAVRSNAPPVEPRLFVFPGASMKPVKVECDRGTILRTSHNQSSQSGLSIGICKGQRDQIEQILGGARAGVDLMRDYFSGPTGLKIADSELVKMGVYFSEKTLADGARQYYFPTVLGGHGALVMENVVLIDKRGAWIITSQLGYFCGKLSEHRDTKHRLCTNTEGVLGEIAQQLRIAFPAQ